MNQKEYMGHGSLKRLPGILAESGSRRVFLVTGDSSYVLSGAKAIVDSLSDAYEIVRFSSFSPNPKVSEIEQGVAEFRELQPDMVLAIGGGSALDVAKVVMMYAMNGITNEQYFGDSKPAIDKRVPIVAVPTTAGSGSEATKFGVFYKGKDKQSLAEDSILPDYVIIDPELMMSMPSYHAAASGVDALGQALESYWSIHSTDESKVFAKEAIELCMEHLVESVVNPALEKRMIIARAANLAGKAINITRTTACHAVAYPFTSYFGLAHGHAVGLTLSSMLKFISGVTDGDLLDGRGADYVRGMVGDLVSILGCSSIDEACAGINEIIDGAGLKRDLRELGLKDENDIELIIANGYNPERVKNIPRILTEDALRQMLVLT